MVLFKLFATAAVARVILALSLSVPHDLEDRNIQSLHRRARPSNITKWVTNERKLQEIQASSVVARSLSKRGQTYRSQDYGDCDAAVNELKRQTGGGQSIAMGLAFYAICGGVVAFSCATWPDSQDTYGDPFEWNVKEITLSLAAITKLCGWHVAGTANYMDWAPTDWNSPLIRYMQYFNGLDFCRAANGADAGKC
ncbi:hypothetical protein V8C42DRAFT_356275 [Trichoderma barbatum]